MTVHPLKMNILRDVQWKWLSPKLLSKFTIWFWVIDESKCISQGIVFSILYEKMGEKKISTRWVPRLLSEENKRNRVVDSEAILALSRRNPEEFRRRYITVDETWIHHYTLETKEQSKQWVFEGKGGEIGRQGDGHGFLGCTWNHLHRLLGKKTTISEVYYASLSSEEIKKKISWFEKEKDPLPSRQCTGAHLRSFDGQSYGSKIRIITTSTYSPDLAPSYFFSFPNLKKWLGGQRSRRTRRSSPKQMPILRTFQNPIFRTA